MIISCSFTVITAIVLSFLLTGLAVGIVVASVGFLFAVYAANLIVRNFTGIRDDILKTDLDPDHRIPDKGPVEIYRITRAVNRLGDSLLSQKNMERSERLKLNSILDGMNEGIIVIKNDLAVEYINKSAINILDVDAEPDSTNRLSSITKNPDINYLADQTISTGNILDIEIDLLESNRSILVTSTPFYIPDDPEGLNGAIIIMTDLTYLKRLNVTRREFISNASHELRTPIAAIKSSAETLRMRAIDDPKTAKKFLSMIEEDVKRIERLVNELMELTKLQSGEIPLQIARVDAVEILNRAHNRFSDICDQNQINFEIEPNTKNAQIFANVDLNKFEQVIGNLISNAIKWTDAGGFITLSCLDKPESIEIKVIDNGRGISAENLPHIFERFFKIDSSRADEGTGLGLSISRHIIELHGGEITAESEENVGSEFTIVLSKNNSN